MKNHGSDGRICARRKAWARTAAQGNTGAQKTKSVACDTKRVDTYKYHRTRVAINATERSSRPPFENLCDCASACTAATTIAGSSRQRVPVSSIKRGACGITGAVTTGMDPRWDLRALLEEARGQNKRFRSCTQEHEGQRPLQVEDRAAHIRGQPVGCEQTATTCATKTSTAISAASAKSILPESTSPT